MEYTVAKLAQLAGVSPRTLRYYDEIGLLKPCRISSSGYRIYGAEEVNRLQQILFFRELEVGLEEIQHLIRQTGFDRGEALRQHRERLLEKRLQVERLIENVEKSIQEVERGMKMSDREKFEGFKKELINENERKYGKEVRERYGDKTADASNQKLQGMSQEDFDRAGQLAAEIAATLAQAFKTQDPAGSLAQKACDLHRQWLCLYWPSYSKEAHAGLGQMYVDDERFTAYYDKEQPGTAQFFRDALLIYTAQG